MTSEVSYSRKKLASQQPTSPRPPALQRSEGSSSLREASQQLQPWIVASPPAATIKTKSDHQYSDHGRCIRWPFHLHAHRPRSLPSMPPGTSLLKPAPVWRPNQLQPSFRSFQARRPEATWRGCDAVHSSQREIIQRHITTPASRQRHKQPLQLLAKSPTSPVARPPSPQLTLAAASASTLSTARATPPPSEDALVAGLAKLRKLFAPEGAESTSSNWLRDQTLKVHEAFKSVSEAQHAPIEFARVRKQETYDAPRLPCVFMHGLFGFSTLTPVSSLPQLTFDYWRGVVELLEENGVEVLVTNVKTSASIEERARDGAKMIEERFAGREINLIGHSMGGLDARFLTACLKDHTFKVKSVTTIATPHLGSPFASYLLYDVIGRKRLPTLLSLVQRLGIPGGGEAFECLTTERMKEFNAYVPDQEGVSYYSWGAAFKPGLFNEFRFPHGIIWEKEGHNDGLVSVQSAQWGKYQGTLAATHIEIIGWGNAIQQMLNWAGGEAPFDTRDFYLMVCEDLARDGM